MALKKKTREVEKASAAQRAPQEPEAVRAAGERPRAADAAVALQRAADPRPSALRPADVLTLQRTVGNRAVRRMLGKQPGTPPPQPSTPANAVQLKAEDEESLQAKFETGRIKENRTGLPDGLKSGVESLSAVSLDGVHVHYNSPEPARVNALAYTRGGDIYVAPGQERHLPHEAWHVVQQRQGRVRPTLQMNEGVPVNDDEGLEREADVMGAKAALAHSAVEPEGFSSDRTSRRAQETKETPGRASNGIPSVQRKIVFTNVPGDDGTYFLQRMDRSVFAHLLNDEEMLVLEKMATDNVRYEFQYSGTVKDDIVAHVKGISAPLRKIKARVKKKIEGNDKFELTYSDKELVDIYMTAKRLNVGDKVVEDLIYTGSRKAKAITAEALKGQISNWVNVVQLRGYPYRFKSLAEFNQFKIDLLKAVEDAGLPKNDVRIQGSSLRKETAGDIDIAVFVSKAVFADLLRTRYSKKVTKNGAQQDFTGKDYDALMLVAKDVVSVPNEYNAQGRTFANAMSNGIISSKSDISQPLKTQAKALAPKYPDLNIESISVLIIGGQFELKPDFPIK